MPLFCFGFGYCARRLSSLLGPDWQISGTKREISTENNNRVTLYKYRLEQDFKTFLPELKKATHILISIPAYENIPLFLNHIEKIQDELTSLKWLGYLSATSVYGDHQGKWVTEKSTCLPTSNRGKLRLDTENKLLSFLPHLPIHIFRISGIYGPGRSAFDRLKQKHVQIIKKENHFFSRIYIDDIALILKKSMYNPSPGEIFNLSDDTPSSSEDYMKEAVHLLNCPLPPIINYQEAELSPMIQSFYQDNKKVSNEKIKQQLNIKLKYPSYQEGLKALYKLEKR